jgi:hypothetical protein
LFQSLSAPKEAILHVFALVLGVAEQGLHEQLALGRLVVVVVAIEWTKDRDLVARGECLLLLASRQQRYPKLL